MHSIFFASFDFLVLVGKKLELLATKASLTKLTSSPECVITISHFLWILLAITNENNRFPNGRSSGNITKEEAIFVGQLWSDKFFA